MGLAILVELTQESKKERKNLKSPKLKKKSTNFYHCGNEKPRGIFYLQYQLQSHKWVHNLPSPIMIL